jgi:hypothetical protein
MPIFEPLIVSASTKTFHVISTQTSSFAVSFVLEVSGAWPIKFANLLETNRPNFFEHFSTAQTRCLNYQPLLLRPGSDVQIEGSTSTIGRFLPKIDAEELSVLSAEELCMAFESIGSAEICPAIRDFKFEIGTSLCFSGPTKFRPESTISIGLGYRFNTWSWQLNQLFFVNRVIIYNFHFFPRFDSPLSTLTASPVPSAELSGVCLLSSRLSMDILVL